MGWGGARYLRGDDVAALKVAECHPQHLERQAERLVWSREAKAPKRPRSEQDAKAPVAEPPADAR